MDIPPLLPLPEGFSPKPPHIEHHALLPREIPLPEKIYTIHYSDVKTFDTCRRKWDYASHLRRGLEWRKLYAPFYVGTAVHNGLEHLRKTGQTVEQTLAETAAHQVDKIAAASGGADNVWDEELAQIDELTQFAQQLLDHYRLWEAKYKGPFNRDEIEFISHEKSFRVPLRRPDGTPEPGVFVEGRIDGFFRHIPTGEIWLYELKTARSIPERLKMLDNDGQATCYAAAVEQLYGEPVAGVLYDVVKKSVPKVPEVLQNGLLSQNKRIDTTFEIYHDAIKKHHGRFATKHFIKIWYGEMLTHLIQKGNQFFARVPVRRTADEIQRFQVEFYYKAMEMIRSDVPIWATDGWHCSWCAFKEPCLIRSRTPRHESMDWVSMEESLLLDGLYKVRDMSAAYGDYHEPED